MIILKLQLHCIMKMVHIMGKEILENFMKMQESKSLTAGDKWFTNRNTMEIPTVWGTVKAWWDGTPNVGVNIGKDKLPPGTYYYILYYGDGLNPVAGYVFLNRQ